MRLNRPWNCGHCVESFDHQPPGYDRRSDLPLCLQCWHIHVGNIIAGYSESAYRRMVLRVIDRLRKDRGAVFLAADLAGTKYSAYHLDKSRRRIEEKLRSAPDRILVARMVTSFNVKLV